MDGVAVPTFDEVATMRRAHSHADEMTMRRRSQTEQVEDLPMFAAPSVAVETSEGAAERVRPTARDAHRVILALLVVHENLTDYEIRTRTGWSESYARPRRWTMEGMGLLEKCDGEHGRPLVKRLTDTGSPAFAYRLTSLGRQRAQER